MKNYYFLLIILVLLGWSCQTGDDLAAKKKKLDTYRNEMATLKEKIDLLEKEVATLDTSSVQIATNDVLVEPLTVLPTEFFHQIEVRGTVESRKNVVISAETMGRIEKIAVEEGQKVSKGQLLVQLDADILENSISEVETSLSLATTLFERQSNLWSQNIGTEIQFLQAKNNKEALERRLATLNSQLRQTQIRAPFDGSIDDIPVRIGEMAQPGLPLLRLVNPQEMYIKADVSEAFLGKFTKGDAVGVLLPSQNIQVSSVISSVSKVINNQNRTFTVEIQLPNGGFQFQPNQVALLKLTDYKNTNAIVVPTRLIMSDDEGKFLFIVRKEKGRNVAVKVSVKTGLSYESKTEILSGLSPNDQLIDKGYRDVNHGTEVKLATL